MGAGFAANISGPVDEMLAVERSGGWGPTSGHVRLSVVSLADSCSTKQLHHTIVLSTWEGLVEGEILVADGPSGFTQTLQPHLSS